MRIIFTIACIAWLSIGTSAQEIIPFDTAHWDFNCQAYVLEHYQGQDAVYIQNGAVVLKDKQFLNGTIEFDIYLTERQSFPGVWFRAFDDTNMENFYLRPHLSGKPDANQATPVINRLTGWQLYFGPTYSFDYEYKFDDWTHVRLVVNGAKAQVYLDHADKPNLSWNLKNPVKAGSVAIGGGFAPMHYANFSIDEQATQLVDFKVTEPDKIEGIVSTWQISDQFNEQQLSDLSNLETFIKQRKWGKTVKIEENSVANISKVADLTEGNTVFARLVIEADKDQTKLFEFGYSDRVVAILNGVPIYKGNNGYRTRDYRFLGTIGLFDAIYLHLKKGKNELLLAISEDFGGWGVMGTFDNYDNIKIE